MTILTYGTYDILHYGHTSFLRRAKEMAGPGGRLLVGLSTDDFHERLKGKPPCYFSYDERRRVLESLKYVDQVFPEETWEQKAADIEKYGADVLVMGDDWKGRFDGFGTGRCRVATLPRTEDGAQPMSDTALKAGCNSRLGPVRGFDLVFPFVDDADPAWRAEFEKYRKLETESGNIRLARDQTTSAQRYRSWGNLRYLFRGIEKNLPWIDRVFLVLSGRTQVPKWLNAAHPKLRLVFHDEYMPRRLLPTFNALAIESYYSFIPDLGDWFIASNDDYFFLNPVPESMFAKDGRLQLAFDVRRKYWAGRGRMNAAGWDLLLNNTYAMAEQAGGRLGRMQLGFSHLPEIRSKRLEQEWFSDEANRAKALAMFGQSRFRHQGNAVLNWHFVHLLKYNCDRVPFDAAPGKFKKNNCGLIGLKPGIDFGKAANMPICCFNDSFNVPEDAAGFEKIKTGLKAFLEKKLPDKSEFEV